MTENCQQSALPSPEQVRQAVKIYLDLAYGEACPPAVEKLIPPESFESQAWFMRGACERDPADAPFPGVRSFALRLGNLQYPHMKLRLSRPPRAATFLFTVDSHDAFLHAPQGSADYEALEALKKYNSEVASAIMTAWDAAGLPTERNYLRLKIREARDRG